MTLSAIFIVQVLIASVHSFINFWKTENQVIQINLPSVQEAPFQLNNQAYNDDIVTLKEFFALSMIIIAGILIRALRPEFTNAGNIFIIIAFCRRFLVTLSFLIIALTFFVRNQSLRKFALKFSCCRCSEL